MCHYDGFINPREENHVVCPTGTWMKKFEIILPYHPETMSEENVVRENRK